MNIKNNIWLFISNFKIKINVGKFFVCIFLEKALFTCYWDAAPCAVFHNQQG